MCAKYRPRACVRAVIENMNSLLDSQEETQSVEGPSVIHALKVRILNEYS